MDNMKKKKKMEATPKVKIKGKRTWELKWKLGLYRGQLEHLAGILVFIVASYALWVPSLPCKGLRNPTYSHTPLEQQLTAPPRHPL